MYTTTDLLTKPHWARQRPLHPFPSPPLSPHLPFPLTSPLPSPALSFLPYFNPSTCLTDLTTFSNINLCSLPKVILNSTLRFLSVQCPPQSLPSHSLHVFSPPYPTLILPLSYCCQALLHIPKPQTYFLPQFLTLPFRFLLPPPLLVYTQNFPYLPAFYFLFISLSHPFLYYLTPASPPFTLPCSPLPFPIPHFPSPVFPKLPLLV